MHGFHRTYRILGNLIEETLSEHSRYMDRAETPRNPIEEIEQEVKLMYARGDIDSKKYYRLIDMAQSGQLGWNDLSRIQKDTPVTTLPDAKPARKRNVEIVNSLNQLHSHRKQLESARQETETVLENLEKDSARLSEQAESAAEKAHESMDNEDAARTYLDTRYKALERESVIQERIEGLRQNLHRIENLEAELAAREVELKALESGEKLADLEADIRQSLLDNE